MLVVAEFFILNHFQQQQFYNFHQLLLRHGEFEEEQCNRRKANSRFYTKLYLVIDEIPTSHDDGQHLLSSHP